MRRLFLVLTLTQLMVSCSNDSSETKEEDGNNSGKNFLVGSKYGPNKNNNFSWLAAIWVDGVPTVLSNEGISVANAIALYNNDIYVVGTESLGNGNDILKLWKNNISENLTGGEHHVEATDIVVSEGNVYIVGNEYSGSLNSSIATVWKNGQSINLSDEISEANAVYVYNGEAFVAGYKIINDKKTAIVWKIGKGETPLYSDKDDLESIATDIYVDKNGVYVTGYLRNSTKSTAMVWKNSVATALSDESTFSEAKTLFVHNSDVYVGGCDIDTHDYDFVGKIWKNGVLVKKINGANPVSMDIKNNKIYIAAFGLDDKGINQQDKIWESGLDNLDFVAKYKFSNVKINAVLVE